MTPNELHELRLTGRLVPKLMPEPQHRTDAQGLPLPGDLDRPEWPFPTDENGHCHFGINWDELDTFRRRMLMYRALDTLGLDATDEELIAWMDENAHLWRMDWMDHRYVETHNGKDVWVCHPYHLDSRDCDALWFLTGGGFRVEVTGASIYYPGATIRVEIHAPDDDPFPEWRED